MKTLYYFYSPASTNYLFIDEDCNRVFKIHRDNFIYTSMHYLHHVANFFDGAIKELEIEDIDYNKDIINYDGFENCDDTVIRLRPFLFKAIKESQ